MKNTGVCPKCGGQEIVVMRGNLNDGSDPRVRIKGLLSSKPQYFVPVNRYLCCACGYLESWVNSEEFVRSGGKEYWEKWEKQMSALEGEQAAQRESAEQKRNNTRRNDPWD